jgi:hypothetical protein
MTGVEGAASTTNRRGFGNRAATAADRVHAQVALQ